MRWKAAAVSRIGSRRPRYSPLRTASEVEGQVLRMRREVLGCWGGRKLARRLLLEGGPELAPSTITGILRRHGLLNQTAPPPRPFQRFERAAPGIGVGLDLDESGKYPYQRAYLPYNRLTDGTIHDW